MANIATIATVAFLKPEAIGRLSARSLLRAMTARVTRPSQALHFGHSYCVEPWTFNDLANGRLYVQHGERWCATGSEDAWLRYGHLLESLWVRWYDDGGDHDQIFHWHDHARFTQAWCCYACDQLRVTGLPNLDEAILGAGWTRIGDDVWERPFVATYQAGNDRSRLLRRDHPILPSRTTLVCGHMEGAHAQSLSGLMCEGVCAPWNSYLMAHAQRIEFRWQGRVVQAFEKLGSRWYAWFLDDWDNCRDPAWLAYVAARG